MKAQLVMMGKVRIRPARIYVLAPSQLKWSISKHLPTPLRWYRRANNKTITSLDREYCRQLFGVNLFDISLSELLIEKNIPFQAVKAQTVNNEEIMSLLKSSTSNYVLSNINGIISKHVLNLGKRWINCHKGLLPEYRGSSVGIWAILTNGKLGATVHYMDEGIDTGPIIYRREYDLPSVGSPQQLQVFESYMVSQCLREVLTNWNESGPPAAYSQSSEEGHSYYMVHPFIAELAYLRISECPIESANFKGILKKRLLSANKTSHMDHEEISDVVVINKLTKHLASKHGMNTPRTPKDIDNLVNSLLTIYEKAQPTTIDAIIKNWSGNIDIGWSIDNGLRINSKFKGRLPEDILDYVCILLMFYNYRRDITLLNTALKLSDEIWSKNWRNMPDSSISILGIMVILQDLFLTKINHSY